MAPSGVSRHTLSVLVEDVEGILSRVTGMFSRRGYSIISLVSAQTENPGINRLTIVVDAVNIFRARVVDVAQESVVVEATGTPGKLAALLDVLESFGVLELVQSGDVALGRGPKAMAPPRN